MTRQEELMKYQVGLNVMLRNSKYSYEKSSQIISHGHTEREMEIDWNAIEQETEEAYQSFLRDVKLSDSVQKRWANASLSDFLNALSAKTI